MDDNFASIYDTISQNGRLARHIYVLGSYSYEVNLQMFWHATEEGEYLVKAGTPLAVWIPIERKYLSNDEFDVIIESANDEDRRNNKIMDYNRYMNFTEMTTLKERIDNQKTVLSLNKNNERFD